MDHNHFDELARTVVHETGHRRAIFRFLAGSALGGVAARLGLAEDADADAKGKKHASKKIEKKERSPQAERKGPGQLQVEGRRKGKKHHRKPKPPVPDPPCPDGQGQCADGACVPFDQCCSDEYRCANGSCVNVFDCCPEERRCDDNLCILKHLCCPEAIPPLCDECQEEVCVNGELVCRPKAGLDSCQRCPEGAVVCPLVTSPGYGLPDGCCAADRVFPDQWHGTSNSYCRPEFDPGGYWCTRDGFPGA